MVKLGTSSQGLALFTKCYHKLDFLSKKVDTSVIISKLTESENSSIQMIDPNNISPYS